MYEPLTLTITEEHLDQAIINRDNEDTFNGLTDCLLATAAGRPCSCGVSLITIDNISYWIPIDASDLIIQYLDAKKDDEIRAKLPLTINLTPAGKF